MKTENSGTIVFYIKDGKLASKAMSTERSCDFIKIFGGINRTNDCNISEIENWINKNK